jgi:hypothetical protein
LALHWFRRYHKRLLIPLAFVVIITFVVLPNIQKKDSRGGGGWVTMGGETITARQLADYRQALGVFHKARWPVGDNERYYLRAAKLAEHAGIRVSTEQAREAIRAIMSSQSLLGTKDFTNAEYRALLSELRVMPAVFEDLVRKFIAAETLKYVMQSTGYVGGEEFKIAYRRENDRVRLRVKDFKVADFEKEVPAPTDDEIADYYKEHKGLPLYDTIALATEPEVSIEYAYVEKRGAEALAKSLRRADEAVRFEELLGGPGAALAGRVAAAVLEADNEERVTSRYDRDKRRLYKLPKPKPTETPKAAPEGDEEDDEENDEEKQGALKPDASQSDVAPTLSVSAGGAGLVSMIALRTLGAAAAEEGAPPKPGIPKPEEPKPATPGVGGGAVGAAAVEPPEEPKDEFKPLEEVRALIERDIKKNAFRDAASRSASRFQEIVADYERLRPVGADALGEGLGLGVAPALAGAGGTLDRFDVLRACEDAGAVHGVTPLATPDALKRVRGLGSMGTIPSDAVTRVEMGKGDEWTGPTNIGRGQVVWRVADNVEPRLFTLEEAKEIIGKRIVHQRASELAAKAANDFRRELQQGKVGIAEMMLTRPLRTSDAKAEPFAGLGLAEVAPDVVAVSKERDTRVSVNVASRALQIERMLLGTDAGTDAEIIDIAGRLASETRAGETNLFRVAVLAERVEPKSREYDAWRNQRENQYNTRPTPQKLVRAREAFMLEIWNDVASDKVKYEESPEFTEARERDQKRRRRR